MVHTFLQCIRIKKVYGRTTHCVVRSSNWSRKTHLALSLLETEYRNHFDFIVIIYPTLRYNSTYKNRSWVWNDPDVIPTEPGNQLYYLIEKIK